MLDNQSENARTWGMACHLAALVGIVLSLLALPPVIFINILGPLAVWLWKKNEHPFIDEQGKESINFQISLTLYTFALFISLFVLAVILAIVVGIGASGSSVGSAIALFTGFGVLGAMFFLTIGLTILQLLFVIFAAIKAKGGQSYRYPLTLRFLK
jgi:uncharacterized protein